MTARHSRLAFAILMCLLLVQTARSQPGTTVRVVIVYNYDDHGNCTQRFSTTGGNATALLVDPVYSGSSISWTAVTKAQGVPTETAATSFDIQFSPGGSPFYDYNSPRGNPVGSGAATGANGTKYKYSGVTVNGNACGNEGSLGIVMR